MVYPASTCDSRLRGEQAPFDSSPTDSEKNFSAWRPVIASLSLSLFLFHSLHRLGVTPDVEERTFRGARLDVRIFRMHSYHVLLSHIAYCKWVVYVWRLANTPRTQRRRSGQSVTASDFGSNGPRFESGRGRCVESLDKALHSHCPKEKPSH